MEDFLSLAPEYILMEMDNDGWRIDAEFNGISTQHYLNTLQCGAQGHWQHRQGTNNVSYHFSRSITIVCHQMLIKIHNQDSSTGHSERKQNPDVSIRLHVVIVCYARIFIVQC